MEKTEHCCVCVCVRAGEIENGAGHVPFKTAEGHSTVTCITFLSVLHWISTIHFK